jgi:hypothetical protein
MNKKMKTFARAIGMLSFLLLSAVIAAGQGTVFLSNRLTGVVDAPVFDVDGTTKLADSAYLAQLYAGPSTNSLAPIGKPLPFRTGIGAGYINTSGQDTTHIIASVVPGAVAYCQVRAWEAAKGRTYAEARANKGKVGASNIVTLRTGGAGNPPGMPAYLVGLRSFQLGRD